MITLTEMITIEQAVSKIKALIEDAIRTGGAEAKNNLIRTQIPICLLHDAVKASFIENRVNPALIRPIYGNHIDEQKLAGFFKFKNQDICILPNNINPSTEILSFDGILKGKSDPFGKIYTERILSVNVRSQLSSISKNFDTLYERTFAEALNLHLRCQKMVLGEFYMIPVYQYDDTKAKNNIVAFKKNINIQNHIEKYINSFNAVNTRLVTNGQEYKYERICLLIVDFSISIPKIYNTDDELKKDGLLNEDSTASITNLSFASFAKTLIDIYETRFGSDRFT